MRNNRRDFDKQTALHTILYGCSRSRSDLHTCSDVTLSTAHVHWPGIIRDNRISDVF